MDAPDVLIAAIADEDRRLQKWLDQCPPEDLERSDNPGELSPKQVLGHISFWDDYAVTFFECKLSGGAPTPSPPNFEQVNRSELERTLNRSFDEVRAVYEQVTARLVTFLAERWPELSRQQRYDFHVPLRHRRHHREQLERTGSSTRAEAGRA